MHVYARKELIMPTSYAHYKFGQKVVERLPEKYQYFAYEYPEYFYPALHGPDLSFYLLTKPSMPKLGDELHQMSGKEYFTMVGTQILQEMEGGVSNVPEKSLSAPSEDFAITSLITTLHKNVRHGMQPQSLLTGRYGNKEFGRWTDRTSEKKLAFLFGFILHYALDRTGHKYVNEMVNQGVASHFTIEAEFDRMLLCMDGYDPLTHKVTDHIHPTLEVAENIKQFFPGASTLDMYGTLRMQKLILSFFTLPTRVPRKVFTTVTEKAGFQKYTDLFMTEEPDPRCFDTNDVLLDILNSTVDEGVEFVTTLLDRLTGKLEWDDRFNYNFDGQYVGE